MESPQLIALPILPGLSLQLRWGPCRASCESEVNVAGLDDLLVKSVELTGSKSGPYGRLVEGLAESEYKVNRLARFLSAGRSI